MKLLLYSHYFAPSVGGVEKSVHLLAEGLHQLRDDAGCKQFDVTLATQTPAGDFRDDALPFAVVRRPSLLTLLNLIRHSDLVHVAGPSLAPLALSALMHKPFVIEHHGYQAICPNGLLLMQPDLIICPGHFQQRHYAECWACERSRLSLLNTSLSLLRMFPRFWLTRKAGNNIAITEHVLRRHALPRSQVIYYGIEPSPSAAALSQLPTGLTFGFVGRFVPEKGLLTLLQAAAFLVAENELFSLRLIGDGPERRKLEAFIHENHLEPHVNITGFVTGSALEATLADVHVVIMPSIWEETAGLAAIEHMMRGRPVIAAQIGGLTEVVADAALTFPAGDADALAALMQRILHDPAQLPTLGVRVRQRAATVFTLRRMIAQHADLYRQSLNLQPQPERASFTMQSS